MKMGVKEMKKEYKKIEIGQIEVRNDLKLSFIFRLEKYY